MNDANFMQVVPNSQRYTNIDQLIETMRLMSHLFARQGDEKITEEINYVFVGLKNSKETGYDLLLKKEVIEKFVKQVNEQAENNMLLTGKLEGAHKAAMDKIVKEMV